MNRLLEPRISVVVAVLLLAGGAFVGFRGVEPPPVPEQVRVATAGAEPSSLTGTWDAAPAVSTAPTSFLVADAAGPSVSIFAEPDVAYPERPSMDNPTHEGLPVVFLVLEEHGPWLKVRVSMRPNMLVAWVQRSEVVLREVPNRVLVEVGARRVTVLHGDQVLLQETVAVGSDRTPTPLGNFFVDGTVKVPNDSGPYGAYQVSVAGFSDVLQSFGGGIGQIAMHGTNQPDLLGQPVSNGCVRMTNDAITRMAELAPLGTPVDVVA